jgi:hypothetical protein
MAGTDWWVLVPRLSEQNVAGTVADAFIVSTPQGSAADKTLLGTDSGQVTVGGRSGYRRAGPFTSQAAAQAYLKVGAQNTGTQIPGVDITPSGGVTASNPLQGLAAIGDFFSRLTQASTWIRVAKVISGGLLLVIGLVHITGADNKVASIARKVPVPI